MILLTGGLGFLGCNLAYYLAKEGQELVLTRHRVSRIPSFLQPFLDKSVEISPCDLGELSDIFDLLKKYPITSIIHAAGVFSGALSLYRSLKVNTDGTMNILEAARIMNISRITFTSSQSVYSFREKEVHKEDEDISLRSPHYISILKKIGELICDHYAKQYGMRVVTIRPSQIYGPLYTSGRNPLQIMVEESIGGRAVNLPDVAPDDGNNHIYVKDCARAIGLIHLAKEPKFSTYNLGHRYVTYAEMAETISQLIDGANITLGPMRKGKTKREVHLDMDRMHQEYGFEWEFTLEKGIRDYIHWLKTGNY